MDLFVKILVMTGSTTSIVFGIWHFFVPRAWKWYSYIDSNATELVAAVARSRCWAAFRFFFASRGVGCTREPGLLLLGCPLSACCGVGRHRGADELLEGSFVDLLPFAEVDRTPRVPFQAGIEELLRVLDGGSAEEGELHDLLVRFPRADAAVMGPDGGSRGILASPISTPPGCRGRHRG